jgi:hypothetical protein
MQFPYKRGLIRKIVKDLRAQDPVCRSFFHRVRKYRQIVDNIRFRPVQSSIRFNVLELISIRLPAAADIQ